MNHSETLNTDFDLALDFHGYGYYLTHYFAYSVKAKKKALWIHDELMPGVENVSYSFPEYDVIYCVSKAVKQAFDKKYPEYSNNSVVMYNQIDSNHIKELAKQTINNEKFVGDFKIVTVGRLELQKGYDIAIETAYLLSKLNLSFKWFFIGDGSLYKYLKKKITDYNLSDYVCLLGRIDNPMPYISSSDLYVQTSRHEGFGLAITEAKILHTPIVTSDLLCVREQIVNDVNGYIVDLNADSFKNIIYELISDKEKLKAISSNLKNEEVDYSDYLKLIYKLL